MNGPSIKVAYDTLNLAAFVRDRLAEWAPPGHALSGANVEEDGSLTLSVLCGTRELEITVRPDLSIGITRHDATWTDSIELNEHDEFADLGHLRRTVREFWRPR